MTIKNLKKAVNRINKAIKSNEKILIFSDADLDGVASLLIMDETLKSLGKKTNALYFPNRGKHGYGLNKKALSFLTKHSPGLLIMLDFGMSEAKGIAKLAKTGIETIIIDHHEPLQEVSDKAIIVNPKQKNDKYPFKSLAACGVVFKVAKEVLGKRFSENIEQNFLELVALGTISDMMPLIEDNRVFVEKGTALLPFSFRPGIRAFFSFFPCETFSAKEFAQKIISILHLTDFKGNFVESYLVLNSDNEKHAKDLIKVLIKKQINRKELAMAFVEEIGERENTNPLPFILYGSVDIPHILTGNIASKLCNKFKKPVFIFSTKAIISRGSARAQKHGNCLRALENCSDLLDVYGGHIPAAGFTIKTKNLNKFKKCLDNFYE